MFRLSLLDRAKKSRRHSINRSAEHTKKLLFIASFAVVGAWLLFSVRAADVQPPVPSDRPFVRLFTEVNHPTVIRNANNAASINQLKQWYVHVHAEGSNTFPLGDASRTSGSDTTFAYKAAQAGLWTSNYRNGSYVSQANSDQVNFGEAASIEQNAPLAIGTWWPGNFAPYVNGNNNAAIARLTANITSSATTVNVTSAASVKPASNLPNTWPYIRSTNTGTYSKSTADYVSWIRINNEIMRITGTPTESNGVVSIPVQRGYFGTTPAAHASNTRVQSPTYIGSTQAVISDQTLAGSPNVNSANKALRYSIKIWQPDGYKWIAQRIKDTFGTSSFLGGHNTVWLDVSSCNQYNNSSSSGHMVWNWNEATNQKILRDEWGQHQKTKLAGLRSELPGIKFTGNNLGSNFNPCTDELLGNAYDGGVFEHWMKTDPVWSLDWNGSMQQNFDVQKNNWPGIYWVRWNYDFYAANGGPTAAQIDAYKRFSYGSLLLAYRTTADRYQYGGLWELSKPDELYFWDWGAPVNPTPNGLADVSAGSGGLYKRDFANGMVIVNPGTQSVTYNLGGTYFDVTRKNSSNQPIAVQSVTIGPKDAAFVMKGVSDAPNLSLEAEHGMQNGSVTTINDPNASQGKAVRFD